MIKVLHTALCSSARTIPQTKNYKLLLLIIHKTIKSDAYFATAIGITVKWEINLEI